MEALRNYFYNKTINKVLDVGTGTGNFLEVLKDAFPNAEITGVDPSKESIEEARKIFPEVIFKNRTAEDLLFADNSFDVVSLSMALHHLSKVKTGLKELKRVVKPGGWIIINELFSDNLNPAQEVHKMFHHFRSQIDRLKGISHRETFRKDEIIQIVREAGITVQFYFEHTKEINMLADNGELEKRVEKMKEMLERINDFPEYEILKPQIEEFREKALEHGLQPATNVVIVGRKQ